jgi:hypothetical protein
LADTGAGTSLDLSRIETSAYSGFIQELRLAFLSSHPKEFVPFLDGLAGKRCAQLLSRESIDALGAFFTPSHTARRIVRRFSVISWADEVVFDPACGAADLLLPVANELPVESTASATLRFWNTRICGCDLVPEFVEAAKLRLVLLAARKGCQLDDTPTRLASLLTSLVIANGLAVSDQYSHSSCIVMNPPYGRVRVGKQPWRDGAVTAAALFVERAARLSVPGTQICALLPEVLRTGSSYANWRAHIGQLASPSRPLSMGLFSAHADVDVFVQHFTKQGTPFPKVSLRKSERAIIGDRFRVCVGAVVPHRDPVIGPKVAYLHPKNAKPWFELRRINETRMFEGRTFRPPFVVVRRTSRPGDAHRATATLVLGQREVAVENHLIVLIPRHGNLRACRELIRLLRSAKTDESLNRTMRCRHLTTGCVSSLLWDEELASYRCSDTDGKRGRRS